MTTFLTNEHSALFSNCFSWLTVALLAWILGAGGLHPAHGSTAPSVAPEDCVPIQSQNVRVVDEGRGEFLVTDGKNRLAMAASRKAAERMAAVAAYHEHHCFIGRDSGGGDVVEYWKGRSDVDVEMPPPADCRSYNPDRLRSTKKGGQFVITDETTRLLTLATRGEVRRALKWARKQKKRCFIGRDNRRYEHSKYVMSYWMGGDDSGGTYLDDTDKEGTYLDDSGGEEDTYLDDSGGGPDRME